MIKRALVMMGLIFGLAAGLAAADEPLELKGKIGIGLDSMPGLTPDQVPLFSNLVKTPDTVVVRWWINEKVSWELQLAASISSQPQAGTTTATTKATGFGTAFKWNFKRPSETSLAQLLVGLDYASFTQGPDATTGATQSVGTLSLFAGPGFEYFMPFLHSASVEASIRLRISTTQSKSDQGSQAAQSSSAIDILGNGFTPLNLSVHYYF